MNYGSNKKLYVRELTETEVNELKQAVKSAKNIKTVKRAQVIIASSKGVDSRQLSETYHYTQRNIANIINEFNESGIESLYTRKHTGKPKTITTQQEQEIIDLTKVSPKALGYPFNSWTLDRLKAASMEQGIFKTISHMSIKRILVKYKITLQRTKTWKQSTDPDFEAKKTHSAAL